MTSSLPAGSPRRVGRYLLGRELGRGGWGVVFEAVAEPEGAPVALKELHPRALLMQPDALERLRREVSAARAVEHPGLVRALDAGVADGAPFVVYELVRGARPITAAFDGCALRERVALVRAAARALGAAHARGVVHRDVSTRNVLVDDEGRVRVTDFGLAWLPGQPALTRTGLVLGTPGAMAPEVVLEGSKRSTAPAVDVWGLGLLLFEALTGAAPFAGEGRLPPALDPTAAAPAPRDADPSVPALLDAVCRRALASDPAARFVDGAALAAALDEALAELDDTARTALQARPRGPRGPRPGARLGRYLLLARIGAGAMGQVFRARDEALGRDLAVKVMDGVASDDRSARFLREQEAAARVRHPNIVAVHDAGETDGVAWLSMDLVEGETLEAVLRRGPLEATTATRLVAACARAVEALHAAGILHRDLKPANLLVDERGAPRLTDFGVAWLSDAASLTRTGQGVGTPLYMAPQQLTGEAADARADIYGLGALLFEALVGRLPWGSEASIIALLYAKSEPPPAPSSLRPGLHPALDAVCARALAPNLPDRYSTAAQLAADLEALLAGSVDGRLLGRRRSRAVGAAAVALGCCGLLAGAVALARLGPAPAPSAHGAHEARAALRSEVERSVRSARSLASAEVDRGAVAARAAGLADDGALRAWLGLLDLARGDVAAARSALATLVGSTLDEAPARALRGGLAAEAGDPRAALDDLEAALAAGLRHPELEAWRVRALARRGLERGDAAVWLERLPGLRAPGDVRAAAADLLEVGCLLGLERRPAAERAFARLEAPPAELRWDLAVLTASDLVARERPPEAVAALAAHARPEGPVRPQEAGLALRVIEALGRLIEPQERAGDGLDRGEARQVSALLELKARLCPREEARSLTGPLVRVVERTLILGRDADNPSLLLALSEAWPASSAVQAGAIRGLFQNRFGEGLYLRPAAPLVEERIAAAAVRARSLAAGPRDHRVLVCLLRAAALCNLGRVEDAGAASAELELAFAALEQEAPALADDLSQVTHLVRARTATARGDVEAALALVARAEQARHLDPLAPRLVRYEALVAAGRDDDALRLLLELALDPPRVPGVALVALAEAAWERLSRAGRWAELRAMYEATYQLLSPRRGTYRVAWLRARAGDLALAGDALDAMADIYGGAFARHGPAVRQGDPAVLAALEQEAEQPLFDPP